MVALRELKAENRKEARMGSGPLHAFVGMDDPPAEEKPPSGIRGMRKRIEDMVEEAKLEISKKPTAKEVLEFVDRLQIGLEDFAEECRGRGDRIIRRGPRRKAFYDLAGAADELVYHVNEEAIQIGVRVEEDERGGEPGRRLWRIPGTDIDVDPDMASLESAKDGMAYVLNKLDLSYEVAPASA